MIWQELFQRGDAFETTCDEIRHALEQRRRHRSSEHSEREDE